MNYNTKVELIDPDSGLSIFENDFFQDTRGLISTIYQKELLRELTGLELDFVHDKVTYSKQNVLRGIHGDFSSWKLVSCLYGSIIQVVVNLNQDSSLYKRWYKFELSHLERKSILIPPGFGNSFFVKSDESIYNYKLAYKGTYKDFNEQFTYSWDDPDLSIDWGLNVKPILSDRDGN